MCTVDELKIDREEFKRLIGEENFEYWDVSDNGDISSIDPNGNFGPFFIPAQELTMTNWTTHFFRKCFCDDGEKIKEEFYFAYFRALRNAGIKNITLDVNTIDVVQ